MVEDFLVATCKMQRSLEKKSMGMVRRELSMVDGGMIELLMLPNGRANNFLNLWQYQP
jgi:hypothetical protein